MTDVDRYRDRLAKGEPAVGAMCCIPDLLVAEALADRLDMVLLDLQHGAAGPDQVHALALAIERHGATPFVRVPWNRPEDIMRALDLGALGIVVPMVETVEQARAAAGATRYPPLGVRSFGPMRPGSPRPPEANRIVQCFPIVETVTGLANVERIVGVDGVDGIFVGAVDLAVSMGFPVADTYRSDEVRAAVRDIVSATRGVGKLIVASARDRAAAEAFFGEVPDVVVADLDKGILLDGARAAAERWHLDA